MEDHVASYFDKDLRYRASVIIATQSVRELCRRHQASPVASIALGRVICGAGLLAANAGRGQMVGVHFDGSGPLGILYGEATHEGAVRGYCLKPGTILPPLEGQGDGAQLSVKRAVGKGILTVSRSIPNKQQPTVGNVAITSGEIAIDIAFYLAQSLQIPSLVSLGVFIDPDGSVATAGGVLIELLPGADDTVITALEKKAAKAPSISTRIAQVKSGFELLGDYVTGTLMPEAITHHQVELKCRCNQERLERALVMLGEASLQDQLSQGKEVQAKCEICGKSYTIDAQRLFEIVPPEGGDGLAN